MVEINNMGMEHHVLRDCGIVILSAVNQRLDILALIFLSDNGWDESQLPLNHIHYQSGCSTVAINPWMNSNESKMSLKAQTVASGDICFVHVGDFFIEPSAKIIDCPRDLIICEITPAADTGTDVTEAEITLR